MRGNTMGRVGVVLMPLFHMLALASAQLMMPSPALGTSGLPMKIDTHCHFIPSWYREIFDARKIAASASFNVPLWDAATHLQVNAKFGIATSVVSAIIPSAKFSKDDPIEEGRALARRLNEDGYNLTVQYPKQFLYLATLTLPDVEGAVIEAVYALDTLKAAGIVLPASSFGELLGTPRYAPLYKVLNDRHAIVFIHPNLSPCFDSHPKVDPTGIPPFVVDYLLDTTRAAMNLVYRNVTRDYPNITFILAHAGGFLSFAARRAASALAMLSGDLSKSPAYYTELSKFNVDLTLSTGASSLDTSTTFFDQTRMTYGSDYPLMPLPLLQKYLDSLENYVGLEAHAKRQINDRNAYDLFGRFLV